MSEDEDMDQLASGLHWELKPTPVTHRMKTEPTMPKIGSWARLTSERNPTPAGGGAMILFDGRPGPLADVLALLAPRHGWPLFSSERP